MGRIIDHLNRRRSKLRESDDDETSNKNGYWTRERLLKMDARFVAVMTRALAKRRAVERK